MKRLQNQAKALKTISRSDQSRIAATRGEASPAVVVVTAVITASGWRAGGAEDGEEAAKDNSGEAFFREHAAAGGRTERAA
jgi:hypothetical protein